jgi:hypothetical protein
MTLVTVEVLAKQELANVDGRTSIVKHSRRASQPFERNGATYGNRYPTME